MSFFRRSHWIPVLIIFLGSATGASSQTIVNWIGGTGAWDSPTNWDNSLPGPDSSFDEVANISNGGTAQVTTGVISPGQIVLGRQVGESGNLLVANGGQISAELINGNNSQGEIIVGDGGSGTLTVQPGGMISGNSLRIGGAAPSKLVVGAATGANSVVNITTSSEISRGLRVIGPNVNFITSSMHFTNSAIYVPQITSATAHSAIKVSGVLDINNGATLRPEFNGVVPTVGSKWNLFDVAAMFGQFTVDTSAAPALAYGQLYSFSQTPDPTSTNGVYGQLAVQNRLVLDVNRSSGAMSINTGAASFSIDGYSIRSTLGALKPSGWNSLQDQGVSDWRESPQGGSVNALSELKPTTSTTITSATPRALGAAYQPLTPTVFGNELEDVTFEYYSAGGVVTQGIINYIGQKQYNNLVLVVDPATGSARMQNESTLSVNIDGYRIDSGSGSLLAGNGQWSSLDDQNAAGGDWRESNSTANRLTELKPTGSAAMTGGSNFGFNLGTLFKTTAAGGTSDLTFQYLFPGDVDFRTGVVVYQSLATGLLGDFNHNNIVDAADYVVWRNSLNQTGSGLPADANGDQVVNQQDYNIWRQHFGQTAGAGTSTALASAVPEPASIVILLAGLAALATTYRRAA